MRRIIENSGAFDHVYYELQLQQRSVTCNDAIDHYLRHGRKYGLRPHRFFDDEEYIERYPDIQAAGVNPFIHFIRYGHKEKRHFSDMLLMDNYIADNPDFDLKKENILCHYNRIYGKSEDLARQVMATRKHMAPALQLGYFDYEWYSRNHKRKFKNAIEAFAHYRRVSPFSPVNPSPKFDGVGYFRSNIDVYLSQSSPLIHYLDFGQREGRGFGITPKMLPATTISLDDVLSEEAKGLNIAFCLHIFYADYVDIFAEALENFPLSVDLYVAASNPEVETLAQKRFGGHAKVRSLVVRVTPNRGRNFGPMLVEFGQALAKYDLLCHLHSKKSLYSGREQSQWAQYLIEYMINDPIVVTRALNAFAQDSRVGVYYPTTFWLMPAWVNHVLRNRSAMQAWVRDLNLELNSDFLAYPVGGMFWCRPKALSELFTKKFTYEDFPAEPLANDGTMLHGLERIIGLLAEKNGYIQIFYYPQSGDFSSDKRYIFSGYADDLNVSFDQVRRCECISFDLFDTLVRRQYFVPDYAKLKLGQALVSRGLIPSARDFVALRNQVEADLRGEASFLGDVAIDAIYGEIGKRLNIAEEDGRLLMQREFELDLEMMQPKDEMVALLNDLTAAGQLVWIISDTYYLKQQIDLILRKIGVSGNYRLMVSSDVGLRKDNGTMWTHISEQLAAAGSPSYIHIGDNVVADAQLPGDISLRTLHILHPFDKWHALGFPSVINHHELDEEKILKWGALISRVGRYPAI